MLTNDDIIGEKLSHLLKINSDGENVFKNAAVWATAKSLIAWLEQKIIEQSVCRSELQMEIKLLNFKYDDVKSSNSYLPRIGTDIMTTYSKDKDKMVIKEVIRW
ncbi:DUF2383 domain-containing protein [Arenibacter certesii]|uniref:DUF2383 domain-containing protein n=1 Tax=Arenibacter certesii TaxID=228955 RepID=A0A918J126_9FLAO|nr:DUF2383 domain-containing protein [Arenibacter certesii]GGW42443.1 hypothetical protein GCM10007383_28750 [Arenibacter certesii]